jgi:hypothetical protein
MSHTKRCLVVLLVSIIASPVYATFIPYTFTLGVTQVEFASCSSVAVFPCGETFTGSLDVDDSILTREGDNLMGTISNFYIQMGQTIIEKKIILILKDFGVR